MQHALGSEHPDTLTSMSNLAETLRAQGEIERAKETHEQGLEIMRRTLGDEHPHTTVSSWNLFTILLKMDDPDIARTVLETEATHK